MKGIEASFELLDIRHSRRMMMSIKNVMLSMSGLALAMAAPATAQMTGPSGSDVTTVPGSQPDAPVTTPGTPPNAPGTTAPVPPTTPPATLPETEEDDDDAVTEGGMEAPAETTGTSPSETPATDDDEPVDTMPVDPTPAEEPMTPQTMK